MLVVPPFLREADRGHGSVEFPRGHGGSEDEVQTIRLDDTTTVQRCACASGEHGLDAIPSEGCRDDTGHLFQGRVRIEVQRGLLVRRGRLLSWATRCLSSVSASMRRSK